MKRIAPGFAALRQAIDAQNADAVRQHAATLAQEFTKVEAFCEAKSKADATTWARNARVQADVIARDAASGQSAPLTEAMGTLGRQCQSCHAMYREQFANGAFRIKNSRLGAGPMFVVLTKRAAAARFPSKSRRRAGVSVCAADTQTPRTTRGTCTRPIVRDGGC